ncbi:MAG: PEP-CTERM sorting domain-containing protein [Desulfomonilia bacterium]|nr:PEP-CTERM sorting domain-containing protein [Desulfomonilia bacterium]
MKRTMRILSVVVITAMVLLIGIPAFGAPILQGYFDSSGQWSVDDGTRTAEAVFEISDNVLTITLTNTALITSAPNEVLAGLFFDFSGTLSNPHVVVAEGSNLLQPSGTVPFGTNLDGEWGYLTGITTNQGRGSYGISATSLDPDDPDPDGWTGFGQGTIIDSSALYVNPLTPNGWEFGLVGGTLSGGWSNGYAVQSAVIITWDIDVDGDINNVWFLYGTDYDRAPPVPEPATLLLLGAGLLGIAGFRRKFKK